jgi:acetyl-CoA carboxylase carboxyltransferase component
MELIFHPSTYEIDVAVEIDVPDDSVFSEERKEFSTSVLVGAINATGTLTSVVGGPIEIAVYDNDSER